MDAAAVHEMLRLLSPNGGLLITVPYGKFENHGWFRNYDAALWKTILDIIGEKAHLKEWYMRHDTRNGWGETSPDALADSGYFDQRNSGAAAIAIIYAEKQE